MFDPEVMARVAERKIQEAIEEGKFDNLPGKGQPLVFDEEQGVPLDIRMANKVLKNAGALPDWLMIQNDIVGERREAETLRARLIRENASRRVRLLALPPEHSDVKRFVEWHARSRAAYLRRLKSVNTSILKFSMIAPSTAPSYAPYRIERDMADFDQAFPTLEQAAHLPAPVVESDSKLRNLARERYRQGGGEVRVWARAANLIGLGRSASENLEVGYSDMDREDIKRADAPDALRESSGPQP